MKLFKKLFVILFAASLGGCAATNPFAPAQPVKVNGVELNATNCTVETNSTFQLEAYVKPDNATNKNVTWKSDDTSIASVSNTGLVKALAVGNTVIHVTTLESGYTATCNIAVAENVVHVERVTLSRSSLTIKQGKSSSITAIISPSTASNKTVNWISSNTSIATVTKNGVVTGVKPGTVVISAKSVDGGLTATCNVVITEPVKVTGVDLSTDTLSLKVNATSTLNASVSPYDAFDKSVSWSSSESSIASVSDTGLVTALKPGTSLITVTTADGGYTDTCEVTVKEASNVDEWTVLIYMCGSTLEADYANKYTQGMPYSKCGLATCDIREIIDTPNKPDDVNIVIETGGATAWTNNTNGKYSDGYSISSQYIQRHHVENGKLVLDNGQDRIKNEYMGKRSVLQSFLEYGFTNYPANKTALILWNHGGGLQGACFNDDGNGYCVSDGLLAKEVVGAVSAAMSNCGLTGQKLEWIGYDACLMQVQDLAELYSPYFKYMLGSQELESGTGWDYDTWLDDLYAGKDTKTVLKAAVDGFIKDNGGTTSSSNDQTLSYLDLSYASEYKDAWEEFALKLKEDNVVKNNRDAFNDLVFSTKKYSDYSSGGIYYNTNGLSDAKDFINKFKANNTLNPSGKYNTYLQNVLDAHSNLIGYFSCGKGAGNSYGVSMFWTIEKSTKNGNPYVAGTDTNFNNWAYLCENYYGTKSTTEESSGWNWY